MLCVCSSLSVKLFLFWFKQVLLHLIFECKFILFSDWNGFRIRSLLPMERKRRDCEQQCGYKVCPLSYSLKTFNAISYYYIWFTFLKKTNVCIIINSWPFLFLTWIDSFKWKTDIFVRDHLNLSFYYYFKGHLPEETLSIIDICQKQISLTWRK